MSDFPRIVKIKLSAEPRLLDMLNCMADWNTHIGDHTFSGETHPENMVKKWEPTADSPAKMPLTVKLLDAHQDIARKYGTDYAMEKTKSGQLLTFGGRNAHTISEAFKEYLKRFLAKETSGKASFVEQMSVAAEAVKNQPTPEKAQNHGAIGK